MGFFAYKKLAQFAVRCALPPRRSESPVCATDNKPSCVLRLLGWFIGSRGFSSLERRPEFWVLQYDVRKCFSFILLHVAVKFSPHCLLKSLSFPHCIFLPLLSKIKCPQMCGFSPLIFKVVTDRYIGTYLLLLCFWLFLQCCLFLFAFYFVV